MKTTKIKATATEKTVTTITLEIEGKKINVTREDAKAIYDELGKLFGPKVDLWQEYKKSVIGDRKPWNPPVWAPVTPDSGIPKPFEITC